ncbi:MAG: FMN-binding negative transcriptional regulator [Microbacterium sp.]
MLLDADRDDLTVVGHVGKPDDAIHGLGEQELLVIVQGPHGYVSPRWYGDGPNVPTWNFVSVHLGECESTAEENLRVLERLVARFESGLPQPRLMWQPPNDGVRATAGTGHGRVPADSHRGRRETQAQPEQAG